MQLVKSSKIVILCSIKQGKQLSDESPRYKVITLRDFNAKLASCSKISGAWDKILGNNEL